MQNGILNHISDFIQILVMDINSIKFQRIAIIPETECLLLDLFQILES